MSCLLSVIGCCAVSLVSASGCIPSRLPVRRGESGSVVDSNLGQPIDRANVLVESWRVRTPSGERFERKDVYRTVTDDQGRFQVPELKEWYAVIPIPDLPPAFNRRLCVTKRGYRRVVVDPWADSTENPWANRLPNPIQLATIEATPLEPSGCPFGEVP